MMYDKFAEIATYCVGRYESIYSICVKIIIVILCCDVESRSSLPSANVLKGKFYLCSFARSWFAFFFLLFISFICCAAVVSTNFSCHRIKMSECVDFVPRVCDQTSWYSRAHLRVYMFYLFAYKFGKNHRSNKWTHINFIVKYTPTYKHVYTQSTYSCCERKSIIYDDDD